MHKLKLFTLRQSKKKSTGIDNLAKSIQAKVDKLKRERKAGKRKEPQSIDIVCTSEDS